MVQSAFSSEVDRSIKALVDAVTSSPCSIATAESLTGGQLAAAISAAPNASNWYKGGVVAYQPDVKHGLLETPPGPVVTADTATAMAVSIARLLGARFSVAVTGVGGPEPEDGQPPGTVFLSTFKDGENAEVTGFEFAGEPIEIIEQTICAALRALAGRISSAKL